MKQFLTTLFVLVFAACSFAQIKESTSIGKAIFKTSQGNWKLEQYSSNIIKATFTPTEYSTNENISDAVILKPLNSMVKQWFDATSPNRSIQWKDFMVEVEKESISFGPKKKVTILNTVNSAEFKGFQFALSENEKIFGGGERALPLDRRGYKFNLYNNPWYGYSESADNLNYSVPFFTSSKGYGLFFDNPSKGYVDIGKTNKNIFEVGFASGELNVYIILGKDYQEILQSYHKLTGTQPLPPHWALGNLMSRFGYTSEQQVSEIAAKMKAESIPVDAIIFDLFWFGDSIKSTMGNLDWVNKKAWPNPAKMIGDFKKANINTILITEPFVLKSSANYETSKQFHAVDAKGKPYVLTDFYFGQGGIIDIFRKDAQQWFWSKHITQMNKGVEGWWGDLGEPEKHPADVLHNLKDFGFKRLFKADEVHNLYGHTWTKMLYNNYAKDYPTKRLFSLNRSGFAGTQRYSIFPWTGDVSRSWSGLKAQLPILLGMSMSGVPYVHSDAGGFAGGDGDNELYIRWLQMAAFTPIFRPHGTALYEVDKNAFSFPSEAALIDLPYRNMAKQIIDLRYSLLPYNYTLAYEQTKFGKPLIAPLYYHFSKDTTAINIADEFMWGENMLIAPILNKGATARTVYLPVHAANYYKFNSSKRYTNGFITDTALLQEQLVYVPEGKIIPVWQHTAGNNTSSYDSSIIEWQYYSTQKNNTASFTLFDDDGKTKQANGILLNLQLEVKDNAIKFFIKNEPNSTNRKIYKKQMRLKLFGFDALPKSISIDNQILNKEEWIFDERNHTISFPFVYEANSKH